jgi:C-terminal processing protease CtpA/Prc
MPPWALYWDSFIALVRRSYLQGKEQWAGNLELTYAKLDDSTGYLDIPTMAGYAKPEDEKQVLTEALDEILLAFEDAEALIVDVRFNGGGLDSNALLIASRFADQRRLAFSKQTREGDQYTPRREFYVEPQGTSQFTKPVFVLTSRATLSAAEVFVMIMRAFPHVTLVGEPTAGAHSDVMGRSLPNGWEFGLSHQVYYTHDGQVYEKTGLPPDVEVEMSKTALDAGADPILDKALELAGVTPKTGGD